jgi:2-dehydro-3-deoxyphosphogluconate aldolase/(4S)-4-hydroxy-2-oxoglutarate aldolase
MGTKFDTVLAQMKETGMVPVFNHRDITVCKKVLEASYKAGIRIFEFTNRGENTLEVFNELSEYSRQFDGLVLGAGTIFTLKDGKNFVDAGAQFIVSPALILEIGRYYKSDFLWIPGCGTVTEIFTAVSLGAAMVKVFPGNVLGPEFVKAVKAVLPQVKIMPTGGVTPARENLSAWMASGVHCVGMGSQLFDKQIIQSEAYDELERQIQNAIELIREIRR